MIEVTCSTCTSSFTIKPSRLKDGYKKYCSRACAHKATRTGKNVKCHICQKAVYKSGKALSGSKSGLFFCSRSCQTVWRNQKYTGKNHTNWKYGTHSYRRTMMLSDKEKICGRCQTKDLRVLAVHHIDGNRKNNAIENLAWLCHNCHHLIHHYPDEYKEYMAAMV